MCGEAGRLPVTSGVPSHQPPLPALFLNLAEVVSGVWAVDAGLLAGPGGSAASVCSPWFSRAGGDSPWCAWSVRHAGSQPHVPLWAGSQVQHRGQHSTPPPPARRTSRARLFRGASAGERGPPLRPGRGWGQGAGRWTAPGRTDGQLPAAPAPGSGSVLCFPQTCLLVSWEHEATLPWRPRRSRGPEWGT